MKNTDLDIMTTEELRQEYSTLVGGIVKGTTNSPRYVSMSVRADLILKKLDGGRGLWV